MGVEVAPAQNRQIVGRLLYANGFLLLIVTFVLLAWTMAILESRRWMWLLPPVFLFWANCHGGFFLGWVILGAYCGEALISRWRKKPVVDERRLWLITAICFLISGVNPNGFRVIEILFLYRASPIQSHNLEWQYPADLGLFAGRWASWQPSPYSLVLFGALAALWIGRRRARPVDWLLYGVFAPFSLMAVRNTIFMGIFGPVLMAALLPSLASWKRAMPRIAEYAAAGLLAPGLPGPWRAAARSSCARPIGNCPPGRLIFCWRTAFRTGCSTRMRLAVTWCGGCGRYSAISSTRAD